MTWLLVYLWGRCWGNLKKNGFRAIKTGSDLEGKANKLFIEHKMRPWTDFQNLLHQH